MKFLIALLFSILCISAVAQSFFCKVNKTVSLNDNTISEADSKKSKFHPTQLDVIPKGSYVKVNFFLRSLTDKFNLDPNDYHANWEVTFNGNYGFIPYGSFTINHKLKLLEAYCEEHPDYISRVMDDPTYLLDIPHSDTSANINNIQTRKDHYDNQSNGSNNPIGPSTLDSNPVVQEALRNRATIDSQKLHNPNTDYIVNARSINVDRADLIKYFPNGDYLFLTDAQIQNRIDELKREEIYKYMEYSAPFILIAALAWFYNKRLPKKKPLL